MPDFVHLHVHSHYSLLDGLSKIDELVDFAKTQGATALALTDHGNMYGAVDFYQKAIAAGMKPIIGMEAYVAPEGHTKKRSRTDERTYHLTLLARNDLGYRHLIKLTTLAHLEGYYYKPRIDHELLRQYGDGLIVLSGCLRGEVAQAIVRDDLKEAERIIRLYQEIIGRDWYYLELQDHPNMPDQARVNEALIALSKKTGAPLVATADAHYLRPEDAEAQDILLCIHLKKQLADPDRLSMRHDDLSLRSPADMAAAFAHVPEAIANTVRIAAACDVTIPLGQIQLPHYEVASGRNPDEELRALCEEGIRFRYDTPTPEVTARLEYELGVIAHTGFSSYLLIVQDFVNWAKKNGIVVGPGRGSAAGSLVSYLLNITNVDPIRYELLFERFLNPERISMPDIDIDFADIRRDDVLKYVESKYGRDHVSQIITFGTMAARAAVRDVGRVLGLPYGYCDRVAKLIPMFATLDQAITTVPELKEIYENDADARRLLDSAKKLEGVARHASRHACGVVITKEPLEHYVPVQHASPDDPAIITQYSLHPIEDLGLLKMDFLGLSNLTILETCLALIKEHRDLTIDLDAIPVDNKKTFSLLQRGDTTGVFQLESGGMKRYLRELKPTALEDIIAMVALYRPGPMELIPQFIAGKHGKYKPTYLDPRLEPILAKTYGVAVYQEQVMQMARDLAGFSLGEADILRKAVGKKILKLLREQEEKFVTGCVRQGLKREVAQKIFAFIEPFARYGFNRAHAACYAVIAYQTAYFKANYPAEFMAALLTSDQHNTDRIALEIDEARRMGLTVLPPDVNESLGSFAVAPDDQGALTRIRFGIRAIKNVGEHLADAIIAERLRGGAYAGLEDFLRRVQHKDLNKKSFESLAKVGAFDSFAARQDLLANVNELLKYARGADEEIVSRQANLFGSLPTTNAPALRMKAGQPAPEAQRAQWEKELLGLYITNHPLQAHRAALDRLATPLAQVREQPAGKVTVAGIITSVKRIMTKTGERMAFIRLEDTTGSIEVVAFPRLYRESADLWTEDRVVIISGQSQRKDGDWKMLADTVKPFAVPPPGDQPLRIAIDLGHTTGERLRELRALLAETPGPQAVELHIRQADRLKIIPATQRIKDSPEFRDRLAKMFGDCIMT